MKIPSTSLAFRFSIPGYFLLFVLVACFSTSVFAESLYVKPSAEVPVRRGKGTDYKIIAVISDGTKVEFIEGAEDWAKIRTEKGKEGWILKRYLSSDPPLRDQISALQEKETAASAREQEIQQKLDELTGANAQTENELTACIIARDESRENFHALQKDTADIMQTKKDLAAALKEVENLNSQLSVIRNENAGLKKNSALKWFLTGGGVLILGWIIGMMTGKSRKRKSTLL